MCLLSQRSQSKKEELLNLIDADTEAFNEILDVYKMPKSTEKQISLRNETLDDAVLWSCCGDEVNKDWMICPSCKEHM